MEAAAEVSSRPASSGGSRVSLDDARVFSRHRRRSRRRQRREAVANARLAVRPPGIVRAFRRSVASHTTPAKHGLHLAGAPVLRREETFEMHHGEIFRDVESRLVVC